MASATLGRLERVDPRAYWQHEALDFTPWLAAPENLALLGDTIQLELELVSVERDVGAYRADIVCRDTSNDSLVLIENQLEATDHSHLGQILTYAAGLNAVTVVWVATRFTDEHRAALEWLNAISGVGINFFGLEVELWRIGASSPAPKFNIACAPNNWSKQTSLRSGTSELGQIQTEYWTAFNERLVASKFRLRPRTARAQNYMHFALGREGVRLRVDRNNQVQAIQVRIEMRNDNAKELFRALQAEKDEIEAELGHQLVWEELPDALVSLISLRKYGVQVDERTDWPAQHQWMLDNLANFERVFRPRILAFNPEDTGAGNDESGWQQP